MFQTKYIFFEKIRFEISKIFRGNKTHKLFSFEKKRSINKTEKFRVFTIEILNYTVNLLSSACILGET